MTSALQNLRVVVTRPADKAANLIALLEERGATALHVPTIAIADPASWDDLDAAIDRARAGAYDWVVFTSVNAVEKTLRRLRSPDDLSSLRVAAVGSATSGALERDGIRVDLVPEEFTGEAVASSLGRGSGRVFLPRVEGAPRAMVAALEQQGWAVDEVVAYRNVVPDEDVDLTADDFDAVTFASASAARNFARLSDLQALHITGDSQQHKVVACIGPKTAEEAQAVGIRVDVVAAIHTDEGLVGALDDHFVSRSVF